MVEPAGSDNPKQEAQREAFALEGSNDHVAKLALFAEELAVGKETVETGRLQVGKHTRTREANVDDDLIREEALVETVPKGHRVYEMPVTRVVGDTTIIPIVEEVLYSEKRLILKEEIHITRRRTTEHFHDTVTLHHQEVVVTRVQGATEKSDAVSEIQTNQPQE